MKINKDNSIITLILINLIPLFGFLFFDWSSLSIILFYWIECAVLIFFGLIKMIMIVKYDPSQKNRILGYFFSIIIFLFFYGGIMALLFFLLIGLSLPGMTSSEVSPILIKELFMVLPSSFSLLLHHGYSFFLNFIRKKEYVRGDSSKNQNWVPYLHMRIMALGLTLFAGLFLILIFKLPVAFIILFLFAKTLLDITFHNQEHENF
ncbi:MAG TPA: DUF6498-containing protein [Candidatus Paceibacterota bacterium]|nr:DUF6498-containing protein [Candidatus Paceibacterota bacterium]